VTQKDTKMLFYPHQNQITATNNKKTASVSQSRQKSKKRIVYTKNNEK